VAPATAANLRGCRPLLVIAISGTALLVWLRLSDQNGGSRGQRLCKKGSFASQAACHEAGHRRVDQGFARVAEALVVLAEAAAVAQPREGPPHRPPPWQDTPETGPLPWQPTPLERPRVAAGPKRDPLAARLRRVLDDLDRPAQLALDPPLAGTGVAPVDPHVREPREPPGGVEAFPGAVQAPAAEPPVDRGPRRVLVRELPPPGTRANDGEDPVEDRAQRPAPGTPRGDGAGRCGSRQAYSLPERSLG
jgi:hypothetical protein